jgi:hypothetical protein
MEKEISPQQFPLFCSLVFAIILKIMKHLTNIRTATFYFINVRVTKAVEERVKCWQLLNVCWRISALS